MSHRKITKIQYHLPEWVDHQKIYDHGRDNVLSVCGQQNEKQIPITLRITYDDKSVYLVMVNINIILDYVIAESHTGVIIVRNPDSNNCLLLKIESNDDLYLSQLASLDGCITGDLPSPNYGYILMNVCIFFATYLSFNTIHLIDNSERHCGPFKLQYSKYHLLKTLKTYYESFGFESNDSDDTLNTQKLCQVMTRPILSVVNSQMFDDYEITKKKVLERLLLFFKNIVSKVYQDAHNGKIEMTLFL